MESELEKYRRRKRLENIRTGVKIRILTALNNTWVSLTGYISRAILPEPNPQPVVTKNELNSYNVNKMENQGSLPTQRIQRDPVRILEVLLKLLIWVLLYVGFLKVGFGAVFFILSTLWFIWSNLRNEPRKSDEPSAYSVFNPNCDAIDGTLKAEHLEKQILFRN